MSAAELPVDSFKEAAPFLRRPFTPQAVKYKMQTSWKTGALVVPYIDARLVIERLNLVCPHLWDEPEYTVVGQSLVCKLRVDGLTRQDLGAGYVGKGLYSDAFKRAAVKFGVGVSLYAIPKMMLNDSDGDIERKKKGEKEYVNLTVKGTEHARAIYALWLETLGQEAFGEPLDHGDALEAVGDADAEENPAPDEEQPHAEFPEPDTSPEAEAVRVEIAAAYDELRGLDPQVLPPGQYHVTLKQGAHSVTELNAFLGWIRHKIEEQKA